MSSLEHCPPEIMEQIVQLLPLHDICSLRLTGRSVAFKATQDHFQAKFHAKRVEMSRQGLCRFVNATQSSPGGLPLPLPCLLRHLTLVAPTYNTLEMESRMGLVAVETPFLNGDGFLELESRHLSDEDVARTEEDLEALRELRDEHAEFVASGEDVALLGRALSNLCGHGTPTLLSLSLEVAVYRIDAVTPIPPLYGGGWKYIWAAAAAGCRGLFASVAESGICVKQLDLFHSSHMLRCSLPCDTFSDVDFDSTAMETWFANVETLSMSLSDKIIADSTSSSRGGSNVDDYAAPPVYEEPGMSRSDESILREASRHSTFTGLSSLLSSASRTRRLKHLNISHFQLDCGQLDVSHRVAQLHSERILRVVHDSHLPSLVTLSLQGFTVAEPQLLGLLRRSLPALQTLHLHCIDLHHHHQTDHQHWTSIFDHCTSPSSSKITSLHLDTLLEDGKVLLFEPPHVILPAVSSRPSEECYVGSRAHYQRSSCPSPPPQQQQQQIRYRLHTGKLYSGQIAPPAVQRWRQNLKNRYGPPGYGAEASMRDVLVPEEIWQLQP